MSVYDTVIFWCPKCEGPVKFQSTGAGYDCAIRDFYEDGVSHEAPPHVLMDIVGDICTCDNCGTQYRAEIETNPTIKLIVVG